MTRAALRRRVSQLRVKVGLRTRVRSLTGRHAPSRGPEGDASFEAWVERVGGRRGALFPDHWRSVPGFPFAKPSRIGVVMHAFYPDLVPEIVENLAAIPTEFDLVITDACGGGFELDTSKLPLLRNSIVLDVDNHGRDILPLVSVVNAGLLDPYELILKIHTKRSHWRESHSLAGSGRQWRESLLRSLLGDDENVSAVLGAFALSHDLGIVTDDGSVLGPEYWGDNQSTAEEILRRIELPLSEQSLLFASGSMYWIRGFLLQGLRALNLSADDFPAESGQVNATTAHALERVIGLLAIEAGYTIRERSNLSVPDKQAWRHYSGADRPTPRARVVAFYLPQFHPIPENDRWWGEGFTEWTNVTAAKPIYFGHHQPKIPLDLGFYDLRLDDVRARQAAMADSFGLAGFMYYYYWFSGRRLLNLPIDALRASNLEQPYCIMWANENWTRQWDGRSTDILIGQDYDATPAEDFIDDIVPFLLDERYFRINGRAVVAVYRPAQIPEFPHVVATWRQRAGQAGAGELLVLSVDVAKEFDGVIGDPREHGLDGRLGFPPHNALWDWLPRTGLQVDERFTGNLLSYSALVRHAERRLLKRLPEHYYPGLMVTFDNTARRGWTADTWYGSNPYTFRRWLATAVTAIADRDPQERVIFVNAWNEWAEGAVLEPTDRFGKTYLLAIRDVLRV